MGNLCCSKSNNTIKQQKPIVYKSIALENTEYKENEGYSATQKDKTSVIIHNIDINDPIDGEDNIDPNKYHLIDKKYSKDEFPNKLGCFGIMETELYSLDIWNLQKDKPLYYIARTRRTDNSSYASFLRYIESCNQTDDFAPKSRTISVTGAFSPPHRVTLDDKSRKLANIPKNATKFAWMYPAEEIPVDVLENHSNKNLVEKWKNDSAVMGLIIGGFGYFNDKNKLLLLNTLVPNSKNGGLQFGSPFKWNHEFSIDLIKQNRFHKITFSHMISTGALYFGWIFPFEELFDNNGNSVIISEYGAFVYLWHEPQSIDKLKWKNDRYFEVIPSYQQKQHNIASHGQSDDKITLC